MFRSFETALACGNKLSGVTRESHIFALSGPFAIRFTTASFMRTNLSETLRTNLLWRRLDDIRPDNIIPSHSIPNFLFPPIISLIISIAIELRRNLVAGSRQLPGAGDG
jgi:hypothetical protein